MFLLYEIISGKTKWQILENAQMVGFVLLITLLLFANGNDILQSNYREVKSKKNINFACTKQI
jgi:hypothetical protein